VAGPAGGREDPLYSLDFFATQWFDESGLGIPLTMEELF
jgi:hypothetical protein